MLSSYDSTITNEVHQYDTSKQRTIKIWNADYLKKSRLGYSNNDILSCIFPSYEDKIEDYSFDNQSLLRYAAGSGITSIGSYSFYSCTNLSSVSFPNITSIGSFSFYNCAKLSSVSFPNTTSIGSRAFSYCSKLSSASFPNTTSIGSQAFYNCTNLSSASFSNVTSIGSQAFYNCSNLSSIIVNNSTLKSGTNGYGVNNAAIYSTDDKRLIVFSPGLNRISNDTVLSVSSDAFNGCTKLSSVSLPNVTSIGSDAFSYCTNLSSVSFPNATSIGSDAFYNCSNLSSVSLPNVTSIGSFAFSNCSRLSSIYLTSSTVASLNSTNAFSNLPSNYKIYVPQNLYSSYINATNWKSISAHIEGIVIEEKDISKLEMTFPDQVILDGSASYTPVPTIVDSYGNPLINGTDFTCTYSNNTGIGTATCVIAGIGTFTGTVTRTFEIINFTGTIINLDTSLDDKFGIYAATRMNNAPETIIDWGD